MPLIDQTAQEYVLAAQCPGCGHQPTQRYSRGTVERAASFPLDEFYRDEKCVRCKEEYKLAWVAVAFARPVKAGGKVKRWAA